MVILNVDHPDVEDFIWCKANEEQKARALRDAGFDMDLDGKDSASIQYQNANNSVRVTDEFMRRSSRTRTGSSRPSPPARRSHTVRARDLMRQIADAAWQCADPGMQYDTTINEWHTCPASRPDQRLEPVQRVHAPRQQRVQPRVAEPHEVPERRRLVRRRQLQARGRDRVHGPGDAGDASPATPPRRSARTPAPTVSWGSATPTSARC